MGYNKRMWGRVDSSYVWAGGRAMLVAMWGKGEEVGGGGGLERGWWGAGGGGGGRVVG